MNTKRSRLYRKKESESKKNLFLSTVGILIVIFLLGKFGIPLLINLSFLLSGNKQSSLPVQSSSEILLPPQLSPLPTATNSANFVLSGKSQPSVVISFYLNDSLTDKIQADKNGNFSFKETYNKGNNKIYVKASINNKTSDSSEYITVLFKDSPPSFTINSPSDGQQFSKDQNEANISGTTESGVKITVNGFWAIVDQNNNFSYKLKLQNGDNVIKIEAVDIAGNKANKQITVKYSS